MIPMPRLKYIGAHKVTGRGLWQLLEDFQWEGHKIPAGFITDGGSIPRCFQWYLNPTGIFFVCFIIHDYLYTTHQINRLLSDLQLKRLMKLRGGSVLQCDSAFIAIRIGGGGKRSWDAPNPTIYDAI